MDLVKWIFGVCLVIAMVVILNFGRQTVAVSAIKDVSTTYQESSIQLQKQLLEQQKVIQHDAWAAQKTKVFIRAKDTKTCMEKLQINTINSEVIECNKDHYVEVRNDELDQFKMKEGL